MQWPLRIDCKPQTYGGIMKFNKTLSKIEACQKLRSQWNNWSRGLLLHVQYQIVLPLRAWPLTFCKYFPWGSLSGPLAYCIPCVNDALCQTWGTPHLLFWPSDTESKCCNWKWCFHLKSENKKHFKNSPMLFIALCDPLVSCSAGK